MKFFFINEIFELKTSLEACFYDASYILTSFDKVKEHIIDYYIP